jgi:hypothetical protein
MRNGGARRNSTGPQREVTSQLSTLHIGTDYGHKDDINVLSCTSIYVLNWSKMVVLIANST